MEANADFEDLLELLNQHSVRYLIVGGLAFIFHAKPRFTKDIDVWVDPSPENVRLANRALSEFGCPLLLDASKANEITQMGVAPNRVDFLLDLGGMPFEEAWATRVEDAYGRVQACWIGLDALLQIKSSIPEARHQEDARVLRMVQSKRRK